jgi:hypothetical protein
VDVFHLEMACQDTPPVCRMRRGVSLLIAAMVPQSDR